MTSNETCFLCAGRDAAVARSDDGLAVVIPFRNPMFENHVVVGPSAHLDTADVDPATWAAIGSLIPDVVGARTADGAERCYLLAIGDSDKGHLHFHVVPRSEADPALGPFVFGPDGWNAARGAR